MGEIGALGIHRKEESNGNVEAAEGKRAKRMVHCVQSTNLQLKIDEIQTRGFVPRTASELGFHREPLGC